MVVFYEHEFTINDPLIIIHGKFVFNSWKLVLKEKIYG